MQAPVTPEQRQAAKREIVRQVEQGTSAKVARVRSAVPQILCSLLMENGLMRTLCGA
jgi:hypothetical protein